MPDFSDSSFGDKERDARTGLQWIKFVHAYCIWRAGSSWRKLWNPDQRWNAERWDYLEAAQVVLSAFHAPDAKTAARDVAVQAELDVQRGVPIPLTPQETKLLAIKRPVLAQELLRDPLYTDARLLSHLPKRKLARMVAQSRQRLAADAAADRRLA